MAYSKSSSSTHRPRKVGVPKFLRFLQQILNTEDSTIITWAHMGTSIQILDIERMSSVILPKYFKHSKYSSFQRQLNYFGFKKWTKTQTEICTFSHPHFVQNNVAAMRLIQRKNYPENPGSRKRLDEEAPGRMPVALSTSLVHPCAIVSKKNLNVNHIQPTHPVVSSTNFHFGGLWQRSGHPHLGDNSAIVKHHSPSTIPTPYSLPSPYHYSHILPSPTKLVSSRAKSPNAWVNTFFRDPIKAETTTSTQVNNFLEENDDLDDEYFKTLAYDVDSIIIQTKCE